MGAQHNFLSVEIGLSAPLGAQRNFLSVGIGLSTLLGAQRNFLSVGIAISAPFVLRERPKVVIVKIPTVRLWKHVFGSSEQNLKTIQRSTNLGSRFYGARFRQKSKIS